MLQNIAQKRSARNAKQWLDIELIRGKLGLWVRRDLPTLGELGRTVQIAFSPTSRRSLNPLPVFTMMTFWSVRRLTRNCPESSPREAQGLRCNCSERLSKSIVWL